MGKVDAGKELAEGEEGVGMAANDDAQADKTTGAGSRKGESPSGSAGSTAARIPRRPSGSNGRKAPKAKHVELTHSSGNGHGVGPIVGSVAAPSSPERKGSQAIRKVRRKSVVTKVAPTPLPEEIAEPSEGLAVGDAPAVADPEQSVEPSEHPTSSDAPVRAEGEAIPAEAPTPDPVPEIASTCGSAPQRSDPRSEFRARAASALVVGRDLLMQAAESPRVSRLLHTASGIARVLKAGLGVSSAPWLDQYGKDPELERELQPVYSFLLDKYWRLQVEHADRVPAGPAILVANHSGALPVDGPVLHQALARQRPDLREPRWLVEDQIYRAPFIGTLLNRLGAVQARAENALRLLGEERPVIVFPEGIEGISKGFAERYRLMRFGRGGFAKIALRMRAPIVPVAIVGAEEASPLLWKLPAALFGIPYVPITSPVPLPSRWMIRFGDPIYVEDLPSEAAQDREVVEDLTDRTRGSIQSMITALLEVRGSAFAR